MPFEHLSPARLAEIREAFLKQKINYGAEVRSLLMAKVDTEYWFNLPSFPRPFNQLGRDLNAMNLSPKLKSDQIPLKLWLETARTEFFSNTLYVRTFDQALAEIARPFKLPEAAEIIVEGLDALIELIQTNAVARDSVIYYRKTFDDAQWGIEVIDNYKLMHDQLHQVQLMWPPPTMLVAMGDNLQMMKPMLVNFVDSMGFTVGQLWTAYARALVDEDESKWISELEALHARLDTVLAGQQSEPVREAFGAVNSLMLRELSRLNDCLKNEIEKLRLEALIKAMNAVASSLGGLPGQGTELVKPFRDGIDELGKLNTNIKELIVDHDVWQGIDTLLRTLSDTVKTAFGSNGLRTAVQESETLVNLRFIKTIVDTKVSPLLTTKTTVASNRLMKIAQSFGAAVNNSDTTKAEQEFDAYKQQAWHRFFEIDAEMKKKCEELRTIGYGLEKINDQLRFRSDF